MGLLAGRLVAGITVEKLGYSRSLLLLSSFSCITFVAMLLTKAPIILGLFTFLIGLGFSAMFPTLQAILISQRPERSSFNVSTFSIAASLGAAASSYMVGFAGKHFGLEKGILIVLMLIVAEIFVTLLIHLQIQKS
jgi:fucose permease